MRVPFDETILGQLGSHAPNLQSTIRGGFPRSVLVNVLSASGLSMTELAESLDLSLRSLQRRDVQENLSPHESDRLYRLARIVALAKNLIGENAAALRWLKTPNRALAGESPFAALDTEFGTRRVEDVLGRIASGGIS